MFGPVLRRDGSGGCLGSIVVGVAQTVLNLIPCLGQIAAIIVTFGIVVYATAVYAHLFGQFGNAAGQNQAMTQS